MDVVFLSRLHHDRAGVRAERQVRRRIKLDNDRCLVTRFRKYAWRGYNAPYAESAGVCC